MAISNLVSGLKYKGPTAPPSLPSGTKVWGSNKTVGQSGLMSLPKPQIVDNIRTQPITQNTPASTARVQPITKQTPANSTTPMGSSGVITPPSSMYTPSGMEVTGNPATFSGGSQPQQTSTPVQGLFGSVAGSLAKFDPLKNPVVSDAYAKAQELNKAIAESKRNEAQGTATILRQAIPIGDQEGQARVLQDQYLKQQQALADEFSGQSALFQGGLQGTEQQRGALSTVGGLAPEATRFDTFGGGGFDPQTRAQQVAEQVRGGLMSPQAAESMMSSLYGGAGATFLNQALQGGGFNYNAATAQSAAQQSNIQTQGTAQVDIARQGLAQATQDYVSMTGAAEFAGGQAQAVEDILTKTGLNNVSSTDYTKAINNVRGRFSDTDFVALNTALREAQIAYTNLLSTGGGTPTGNEENALATLNINQSAAAIKASIRQLENAVARRLQALQGVRQQYEQNLGGAQSSQQNNDPLGIR